MIADRHINPGAENDPVSVAALLSLFRDHPSRDLIANLTTRVEVLEFAAPFWKRSYSRMVW